MKKLIELRLKSDKEHLDSRIMLEKLLVKEESFDNEIVLSYEIDESSEEIGKFIATLSDFIIKNYEKKLLKGIILEKYEDVFSFKLCDIINKLSDLESDYSICEETRKKAIQKDLLAYFKSYSKASVSGLAVFRLKEYKDILEKCAEKMIELHTAQKEYEEFIGLLKYFVKVQGTRPNLIHLYVNKRGMYTVLDENNKDITDKCVAEFAPMSDIPEENFDDLLISVLITLAPEKIVVHNSENIKNHELFDTIKRVFEKVEYCLV